MALMLAVVTRGSICDALKASSLSTLKHQRSPLGKNIHHPTRLFLKSDGLTPEERDLKIQKATKAMTAFTNTYLKNTDTRLCDQKSIPAVVIKGLAEHKVDLVSQGRM